jgi:hypothetical protein
MLKKSGITASLFALLVTVLGWTAGQREFDRTAFYKAMASDKLDRIDEQIQVTQDAPFKGKEAFEGCLLMKRSGLIAGANKKLSMFKAGRRKLENSIAADSLNVEFRFLRLIIQEHAPGIVGYRNQLNQDHVFIIKYFKNLRQEVRDAIIDYSKKSRILKPADFNFVVE